MLTLTCCQDHILTENIWFVCSETSYSGGERRCHRCGTTKRPITEDRATQPMEAGGWVSQFHHFRKKTFMIISHLSRNLVIKIFALFRHFFGDDKQTPPIFTLSEYMNKLCPRQSFCILLYATLVVAVLTNIRYVARASQERGRRRSRRRTGFWVFQSLDNGEQQHQVCSKCCFFVSAVFWGSPCCLFISLIRRENIPKLGSIGGAAIA